MEEDTEYLKLPIEDRCVHKLWKARVNGYEECSKLFAKITDEKSPEFSKYAPLIKKFVTDSNAVAQEKALDAVLAFVENAHVAGRTAGEATSGIVLKCLAAPKRTTQEKALEVLLMYCEIEKYEPVQEELMKGFAQKNPKVVCGCVKAICLALREFGNKVISIKSLVKTISPLLEDRDKNVRDEAKKMVVEMYRWVGPTLKPLLTSLKPIQIQELETEFDKLTKEKPVPTRYLRSQQELKAKAETQEEGEEADGDEEEDNAEEIDPYDLMSPVNILDKLPKDFFEKVEAKKWQERKEVIDALHPLTQHPRLETGDYAELVRVLKKIIAKDNNVMIVALACLCMAGIAKGLKKKFSPFAIACLETLLEKFKEKKQNVVTALREATDAIFQSTTIEAIQEIACAALGNKNPNVKAETAAFLARSFCYCTPVMLNKKLLKVYTTELLKTLNESDATVRENSAEALGTALKVVGEKNLAAFLSDVDALKMQKIKEASEKAEIKVQIKVVKSKPAPKSDSGTKEGVKAVPKRAPPSKAGAAAIKKPIAGGPARGKKASEPKGRGMQGGRGGGGRDDDEEDEEYGSQEFHRRSRSPSSEVTNNNGEDDDFVDDSIVRKNISSQITSNLISELGDKNWKVRIEALGKVSTILNEAKFIVSDIDELPTALCARLNDLNKNIAAEALRITSALAAALGPHCKPHTRIIIPGIFAALGDTKKSMREQALSTLNSWVEHSGALKDVIDGDMCVDALKSGSPFLKAEIILWMAEKLKEVSPKTLNKEELHACVPYIFSGLEDRNADIRKASSEAVLPFMIHLGYDAMVRHTSKVKPSSRNAVLRVLEEAKPNLPARPQSAVPSKAKISPPAARSQSSGPEKPSSGGSAAASKVGRGAAVAKRGGVAARPQSSKLGAPRKEEEVDNSPLLQINSMKQQRVTEEQRLKTLRWDFATPRAEFIAQLKEQMIAANVNSQLTSKMFHQDFKFHIKAIDALAEDLAGNVDACVANLDLMLRWLTIRFFDTNPSVILKAMDYLKNLFTFLSDDGYHLMDHEAYSFIPYLVMKFGDPKDAIRGPARNIIKLICSIYPASKVSPYILEGLKSKNARQRAECLEALGSLIEGYGMSICQPTAGAALKEVAKQIADRDNSVRNAALNCLLQVYFREGEKVYKMIGNLSDKDHSLLEERIKRSAKNKSVIKKPAAVEVNTSIVVKTGGSGVGRPNRVIPVAAAQPPPLLRESNSLRAGAAAVNDNTGLRRFGQRPLSADMSNMNSCLKIDYDFFEKLFEDDSTIERPKFELEEIPDLATLLNYKTPCPFPSSRLVKPGFTSAMKANVMNANVDNEDASQVINMVVSQVATLDVNTVITALSQLDEVIQSEEQKSQLIPHVDQLLIVATLQYRLVLNAKMADENTNKEECIRIYRSLTNCLMSIFNDKELGIKATRDVLHDVIHAIISILLDSRLPLLEDGNQVVRALNVVVVRIIEKAQFTQIFSALLKLLHESVGGGVNPKFTELVMKCNWKGIRIMPSRVKDINPVQLLQDAHDFMEAYPSNTWGEKPSNIPLRTIKTVTHTLITIYGKSILTHLGKVPNSQGSELQKYIIKILNQGSGMQKSGSSLSNEEGPTDSNKLDAHSNLDSDHSVGKSPKKLSKAANNTLSEIFRKIGSKENTKQGLVQLYEFKQNNPDANIDSYLLKSSQFFQNYIERGLKKVEMERQSENKISTSASSDGSSNVSAPLSSIQVNDSTSVNLNELVDQFKALAAQAGFDNTYIDCAVKDICGAEKKTSSEAKKEYLKTVSSSDHPC